MSLAPSTSAGRGEITLQPSYFTSSIFVHPLRDDILHLIHLFTEQYTQHERPYALFKTIWNSLGWTWIHFKVFEARSRDSFLQVSTRLFLERIADTETPLTRVVALFGLYTFFFTQPSVLTPPLHSTKNVPIPTDLYTSLLSLPNTLTTSYLQPVRLHTIYILSTLLKCQIFHVVPSSHLFPLNPREVPREIFLPDGHEFRSGIAQESSTLKKRGRPSKRDKAKKAKDALGALDKWLDKTTYLPTTHVLHSATSGSSAMQTPPATHVLMSNPSTMVTRNNYRSRKSSLLDNIAPLYPTTQDALSGRETLVKANHAVLARLKRIDQLAAEQGLEVGGEGGERTGLQRVARAVAELDRVGVIHRRGGILALMEGGGTDAAPVMDISGTGLPPIDGR